MILSATLVETDSSSSIYQSQDRKRNVKKLQVLCGDDRSSHPNVLFQKRYSFKKFAVFIGKHLCWSLFFNIIAVLKVCNLIKKQLQHRCFPVNITKFSRTPILKNMCQRLLLKGPLHLAKFAIANVGQVLVQVLVQVHVQVLTQYLVQVFHFSGIFIS